MRKPETITMTMRELDRLKVIQAVVDGLAVWRAAEKLSLSRRHALTALTQFVGYDNLMMLSSR